MFSFAKKLVDRLERNVPNQADESFYKGLLRINNNGFALRVLHVQPHSASLAAGIEAWFDYIVRINNHELPMKYPMSSTPSYGINDDGTISYGGRSDDARASEVDYDTLAQELATIASSSNKSVTLDVWSAKGGVLRLVVLPLDLYVYTSNKQDDRLHEIFHDRFKQLGITVQSHHVNTATYAWRILNTHLGSPAFQAQLIPYLDYVIGCDSSFPTDQNGKGLLVQGGEALFSKTILNYYNHHYATLGEDNVPITLYVYNHDYDILRPVTVHLSKSWAVGGSRGILGCDVGYGLLHRIPEVVGKFDLKYEKIDDVLFENKSDYSYKFDEKGRPDFAFHTQTSSVPSSVAPSIPASTLASNQVSKPPSPLTNNSMGMVAYEPEHEPEHEPQLISACQAHTPNPPARNAEVRTPLIAEFLVSTPQKHRSSVLTPRARTPSNPTFTSATISSPAVIPSAGVPPSVAPPKIHRKKRHFASNGLGDLTDFMNEELTKSKNSDVKYPGGDTNGPPPPPPPKTAK